MRLHVPFHHLNKLCFHIIRAVFPTIESFQTAETKSGKLTVAGLKQNRSQNPGTCEHGFVVRVGPNVEDKMENDDGRKKFCEEFSTIQDHSRAIYRFRNVNKYNNIYVQ